MGIYLRNTTAVLTLFVALATASSAYSATLHPVPSIAKALAAGPSGVMPSGLTVQRSQQLGVMLLKSQVQLALGNGVTTAVTRGASLSVSGVATRAVTVLKNGNPGKIIGGALITAAISKLPGASIDPVTGGPVRIPGVEGQYWIGKDSERFGTVEAACQSHQRYDYLLEPYGHQGAYICTNKFGGNGWTLRPQTLSCPYGSTNYHCNSEPQGPSAFAPADYDELEAAIPSVVVDPADVVDLWNRACGGDGKCMSTHVSDPTLTGLPSVQGPRTTTTSSGPNGDTTTTRETKYDLDYSDSTGVIVRERTTTTTTNPDGSTKKDITTDTGPVVVAPPSSGNSPSLDGSFADTPFPEVTPFYEQKYPEGLEGVWSARKAEFEDSAFIDFLRSFVPSFSGSCPAWSINVNVASWAAFGIHDFQTLCWVFDFVKVVLLVSAAFLCRSLIFGG